MGVTLNPYISFPDIARHAMEFYHSVLGGELTITTFGDSGMSENPDDRDKVMHAQLVTPGGLVLMAGDTPASMVYRPGGNMAVSLSGDAADELRGYFEKLSEGGTDVMPLEAAPWGDTFGMCVDKFGIQWMVDIAGAPA